MRWLLRVSWVDHWPGLGRVAVCRQVPEVWLPLLRLLCRPQHQPCLGHSSGCSVLWSQDKPGSAWSVVTLGRTEGHVLASPACKKLMMQNMQRGWNIQISSWLVLVSCQRYNLMMIRHHWHRSRRLYGMVIFRMIKKILNNANLILKVCKWVLI